MLEKRNGIAEDEQSRDRNSGKLVNRLFTTMEPGDANPQRLRRSEHRRNGTGVSIVQDARVVRPGCRGVPFPRPSLTCCLTR